MSSIKTASNEFWHAARRAYCAGRATLLRVVPSGAAGCRFQRQCVTPRNLAKFRFLRRAVSAVSPSHASDLEVSRRMQFGPLVKMAGATDATASWSTFAPIFWCFDVPRRGPFSRSNKARLWPAEFNKKGRRKLPMRGGRLGGHRTHNIMYNGPLGTLADMSPNRGASRQSTLRQVNQTKNTTRRRKHNHERTLYEHGRRSD